MSRIIKGTKGADRIYIEGFLFDDDVIVFGFGGNDSFEASFLARVTIYGGGGRDTLTGGGRQGSIFYGEGGNDFLNGFVTRFTEFYGGSGNDRLVANDEGMILDGGSGVDTMIGGDGADTFIVDSVRDVVAESFVQEFDNLPNPRDRVESSVSWTLGARLEDLTLTGSAKIKGSGNSQANVLVGNSGNNTVSGRDGNDQLRGMGGSDRMIGGAGQDRFVFVPSDATVRHVDVLVGFNGAGAARGDRIDVRALDADLTTTKNDAFIFGSAAKGGISLRNDGADTLVRFNMDADRDFEWSIRIEDAATKSSTYAAADFFL